jgi:Arc/MetJ-type ribon-helix-helix transcriptional regulator
VRLTSTDEYTTVRLPKELMEEIDNILKRGVMGYKSRAEFIKEAIREKLKTIPREILEQLPLEHFNLSENGVRILDRSLANEHSRGRIIDVYFKPDKVLCEYCESTRCQHVKFALDLPEVQKILHTKGWKIPK